MSTKGKREIHKYYRVETSPRKFMWACAHSDCTHHMPSHYERMLLNKGFVCWQCGTYGSIRQEHLDTKPAYFIKETGLIHPICDDCRAITTYTDDSLVPEIHRIEPIRPEIADEVIANLADMMKRR